MSDPGTTYRTREEVQRMRSTQDPIRGLQRYIEEWGLATEQELKVRFSLISPHSSSIDVSPFFFIVFVVVIILKMAAIRQGGQGRGRPGRRRGKTITRAPRQGSLDRHLLQEHRAAIHAWSGAGGGMCCLFFAGLFTQRCPRQVHHYSA